jgi:uncharacterized membrane protein YheB (UPF0754 family)
MATKEQEETSNFGEIEHEILVNNIRFEGSSLLEHFHSLHSWADQIALLSCVQEVCERMEAHLEQVMEKERPLLEHALDVAEKLKENQPDSN